MSAGRLILICGLPGVGKTTLAKRLETAEGAVRLCADEWMQTLGINLHKEEERAKVESLQWQFGRRLLQLGQCVIVEWGTWGRWERDRLREEARAVGCRVALHYLSAPPEELFRRIQDRAIEDPAITWEDVLRWRSLFEAPDALEGALFDEYREDHV